MNNLVRGAWICILLAGAHAGVSQQPKAFWSLSPAEAPLGEAATLTLTLESPVAGAPDWNLSSLDTTRGIEVLESDATWDSVRKENGIQYRRSARIIGWEPGEYRFARISAGFTPHKRTERQSLTPATPAFRVLPINLNPDEPLKDIVAPARAPLTLAEALRWLAPFLVLLALVALAWYAWRRWKASRPQPLPPPGPVIPLHKIYLELIDQLEAKEWWQKGQLKTYYSELADTVRAYLENRYPIPALESTTYEILRDLRRLTDPPNRMDLLQELLDTADLVKFARSSPDQTTHLAVIAAAREFIRHNPAPEPIAAQSPDRHDG